MRVLARVWATLVLGVATFTPQSQAQTADSTAEVKCPVHIYLFLDLSASLKGVERDNLVKGIEKFVKTSEDTQIFPSGTVMYLVPFGGKVLHPHILLSDWSKIRQSLDDAGSRRVSGEVDAGKTDLTTVVSEMFQLGGDHPPLENGSYKPYNVFVVASDFTHDPQNKPKDIIGNKKKWNHYFETVGEDYYKLVDRPAGNSILLLKVRGGRSMESAEVSEKVVADLRGTGRDADRLQVAFFSLDQDPFSREQFLAYLKPIDVEISRKGSFSMGNPEVTIHAVNRSCLNLGELDYSLQLVIRGEAAQEIAPRASMTSTIPEKEWEVVINPQKPSISLAKLDSPEAYYRALVMLPGMSQAHVGVEEVRTHDYLLLSSLQGIAGGIDSMFSAVLEVEGDLTDHPTVPLDFALHLLDKPIANGKVTISRENIKDGRGVVRFSFGKMRQDDFESLCYSADGKRDARLVVAGPSTDLVPQNGNELLVIPDGDQENPQSFLRELFEQASLPALVTTFLSLCFLWRNASELERVEKVVAIFALVSTTTFVALHHLTKLDEKFDSFLEGPGGRWMAAGTILMFLLLAWRVLLLGGLPFPSSEGDLLTELALERKRGVATARTRSWNLLRMSAAAAVAIIAMGLVLFWGKGKMECTIRVSATSPLSEIQDSTER